MTEINTEFAGDVFIRDFDIGMFNALECEIIDGFTYLPLSKAVGVKPPLFSENHPVVAERGTEQPGIPIIFKNPGDSVERYDVPCIRIAREDPTPALDRWMSLHLKHRGPAPGATPVTVQYGNRLLEGYDKYQEQQGSWPYDVPYTVTCEGAGITGRTDAQIILLHAMKKLPPYAIIPVIDSKGDTRTYNAFVEGPSDLSQVGDLRDRIISYALSIRVSAEYDLADPVVTKVVTAKPRINTHQQ